ncbi:hypothetical protein BDP27DRAFT_678986 [Rhodocollybia butyracea]|uniref:Uncharacterized protein n=1 Tax=Rhodocollybia butyracea TaxID=206335 RepID=A0A9P5PPA3_9AGAR|nr:hypothetical protein BDP27DRAFT_678986 [Rhodocollybia butyracea]
MSLFLPSAFQIDSETSIVPTEAHRQAYAQQMQSQQAYGTTQVQYDTRPRHPSQPNPADSVPSSRSRSQSQALRSSHRSRSASAHPQSASSTAHMLQGSVTHMSQGTDTRHERQSDERRYRLRDREDLSNSVPSLVSDSAPPTTSAPTSTSTTPTRPSRLARPSTASAAPAAAPTTRGRTGRNRYEVSRTDSGSRHIRTHSVDARALDAIQGQARVRSVSLALSLPLGDHRVTPNLRGRDSFLLLRRTTTTNKAVVRAKLVEEGQQPQEDFTL